MTISTAVALDRISRIVGYQIKSGDFSETSRNLPQRIAIFGESNTANQAEVEFDVAKQITSAQQAGQLYGWGSPIYQIMRILRPKNGGGVGGIATIVYPQEEAVGATAAEVEVTPTGVATGNGTHTVIVNGRGSIDGFAFDVTIAEGDTTADITAKIEDAINNVLGSPVSATSTDYEATLTTKWKGLTANGLNVEVDTGDNDLGITYAVVATAAGSGTPSVQPALDEFGEDWNTIVINGYGAVASVLNALEAFNGVQGPETPTGRYTGIIMKPFIALFGDLTDDATAITDARKDQVTNAVCPAPNSDGFAFEAAANMAVLFAPQAADNPHLDVAGKSYPDMPTALSIGAMGDYENRDLFVKKGASTVKLVSGRYQVQDFVTTYHPVGESPAQFNFCRNIMIDLNIYFGYYLLEQINVVDHSISADDDTVTVGNIIKPKQWKGIIDKYADDLAKRGLIAEPSFMQDAIAVQIGSTNPDRLETTFRYKRSGFARIVSTTVTAGFNFGS